MTKRWPMPTAEGFYWGKWRIANEGTKEGDEQTPSDEWEVMHVVENTLDYDDPDHLMVMVPGQASWQSLENFFWGPGPLFLPTELEKENGHD